MAGFTLRISLTSSTFPLSHPSQNFSSIDNNETKKKKEKKRKEGKTNGKKNE